MTSKGQTVGYVRVSTEEQHLDRQLAAIGAVDRMFTDKLSGARGVARPALEELLAYCRAGDTVRVSSLDRLARSLVDLEGIVDQLTAKGVVVEFVTNRLRFPPGVDDPFAVFQRQMLAAVAQFERGILRERQREGIEQAKARGVYKGRKPALDAADVAAARRRHATGETTADLAQAFGCSRRVIFDVGSARVGGGEDGRGLHAVDATQVAARAALHRRADLGCSGRSAGSTPTCDQAEPSASLTSPVP